MENIVCGFHPRGNDALGHRVLQLIISHLFLKLGDGAAGLARGRRRRGFIPDTWGSQTRPGSGAGGEGAVRSLPFGGAALGAGPGEPSRSVMDEIPSMGVFTESPGNGGFHA